MSLSFPSLRTALGTTVLVVVLSLAIAGTLQFPPPSSGPPAAYGMEVHQDAAQREIQEPFPPPESEISRGIQRAQKKRLLKSRFDDMKEKAEELAALAKALQEEVDRSNENILSLKVVETADKIEKLAKKIKNTAKGL